MSKVEYIQEPAALIRVVKDEIVRRMQEDYNGPDEHENEIAQGVCAGILAFIETLPKEPSAIEKLTDVLKSVFKKLTEEEKEAITLMMFSGGGFGGGLLPVMLAAVLINDQEK